MKYQEFWNGACLFLPDEAAGHDDDFRLGAFTVILRMPEFRFPADALHDGLLHFEADATASSARWAPGRFKGISYLEEVGLSDTTKNRLLPRISYNRVSKTYQRPLADALGGSHIDLDLTARWERDCGNLQGQPGTLAEWNQLIGDEQHGSLPKFQHLDFLATEDPANREDSPRLAESVMFTIAGENPSAAGRIGLMSAEVAQYPNRFAHLFDENGYSDTDDAETFRYLILHFDVQNCTAEQMLAVASSIRRSRNKIDIHNPTDDSWSKTDVLTWAFEQLEPYLRLNDGSRMKLVIARGGFIGRTHKQATQLVTADGNVLDPLSTKPAPAPMQVITATVPGPRGLPKVPQEMAEPFNHDCPGDERTWDSAQVWAWLLAAGADAYTNNPPSLRVAPEAYGHYSQHRSWSILACEGGTAMVRRPKWTVADVRPLNHAQTRLADLTLLNVRAFEALSRLDIQLAEARADTLRRFSEPDGRSVETAPQKTTFRFDVLVSRIDRLEQAELALLKLRDELWFSMIPKHQLDTDVMRLSRKALGNDQMIESAQDEMNLRREIYRTQYSKLEVEQARRREDAREAATRARENQSSRLNAWLAVIAIALGAPTIVDLFYEPHNVWLGLIGLAAPVMVFAIAVFKPSLIERLADRLGSSHRTENDKLGSDADAA